MTEWNALTSDLEGTKSSTLVRKAPSPRLSYLVTDQVPPFLEWQSTLISDMEGTKSSHHDKMAQPLHLTCSSKWLWDSSFSLGGNLDLENTKLLPKVLELQSG